MKILICLSNVPDTTTKAKFANDNKAFDTTGVQWIINPWDELALTRALELKANAANGIQKVTVITVGKADAEPTIRKALAIGADDAVRIDSEPKDAYFVAAQIAEYVKSNPFDIIINGIESSDYNGSAVGGMLAEFLNIPSVSAVSSLKIENGGVKITRDIDGGKEIVKSQLPVLLVVQKGIAKEPMIAAMRGIMMAKTKPLAVVAPQAIDALTEIVSFELPKPKPACKMIDPENVKELVNLLQNEAKVI
ncbi:MAG: electron transfer flavoprotein subunit beta/FixA family protein [Bacteroidales bacterium]|jgi:electron transfer flavoprotein beta subunit|nr:electron transfer flavoprotein subunit beta/FixA family protein [Bacteroidales bacterium]